MPEAETRSEKMIESMRSMLRTAYHDGLTRCRSETSQDSVYQKHLAESVIACTAPEAPRPSDDDLFIMRMTVLAQEISDTVEATWHPDAEFQKEDKAYLLGTLREQIEAAKAFVDEDEPQPAPGMG
ncbi:hypothetical protein [Salipiger mucosus]|uniref:Uncharacterized protein n=1 Tax=Salipiger mucosus DSM 16094 TaxID=1123237 RepID=S9QTS1_9RHOB|nr:hypothetical protein [Salipiger mucosus]EPX84761.1 hypothetical protein Salmuc_01334 [Salipiger mucosus DSM 16094]